MNRNALVLRSNVSNDRTTASTKQSVNTKLPRLSKSREALTNITNQSSSNVARTAHPKGTKTTKTQQTKATKRPAESEDVVEPVCEHEHKRRKSTEPMIIDEEPETPNAEMVTTEPQWENIDASDYDDPQAVVELVNDIYEFLMTKERVNPVSPRYMTNQTDVNEKMRAILIDWLVEVHRMFKLLPETLFMTVNVIDRYLEKTPVSRDKLQLVGITSMFIGSKYEEIYAPECNDFVYIADGAYTKEQILRMETEILNTLNFNLTTPTALHFLRRYSKAAGSDYTIHTLCKYLIELSLIDIKLLRFVPSEIAAGSVYLARVMTGKSPLWTPTLHRYTTYCEEHTKEVAIEINDLLKRAQKSALKAVHKKYAHERHGHVSEIPLVDL